MPVAPKSSVMRISVVVVNTSSDRSVYRNRSASGRAPSHPRARSRPSRSSALTLLSSVNSRHLRVRLRRMSEPPFTLRPLEAPRSLAEDAADRIREQILGGGFKQGEHLVEAKIAEQLNISRGPVREAFKLLRAEGLLNEEPRRGTFVVSLTADDVREIYGLRAALEGRAGRMVARAHDPAALVRLRALVDDIDRAVVSGDPVAASRADLA